MSTDLQPTNAHTALRTLQARTEMRARYSELEAARQHVLGDAAEAFKAHRDDVAFALRDGAKGMADRLVELRQRVDKHEDDGKLMRSIERRMKQGIDGEELLERLDKVRHHINDSANRSDGGNPREPARLALEELDALGTWLSEQLPDDE